MSALAISPARVIVRPGGQVTFVASGGSGAGYAFSFATGGNKSGGTLDSATGAYVAGARTIVTDKIVVTDSASATASAAVDIASTVYRNYQGKLVRTGDWQGPRISLLEQDLGSEKDIQFERARQAVLSNNPTTCPPDALDTIGQERQLPRATTEVSDGGGPNDQAYAARLLAAWDTWALAGSHGALLQALARAGFPTGDPGGAHVMQRIKLYSWLAANVPTFGSHPTWMFDGSGTSVWNQFGIIFGADVAGLTVGSASAKTLNGLAAAWKPGKARFMGTWIVLSGAVWGWPVGATWGSAGRTWGGSVRYVPPT